MKRRGWGSAAELAAGLGLAALAASLLASAADGPAAAAGAEAAVVVRRTLAPGPDLGAAAGATGGAAAGGVAAVGGGDEGGWREHPEQVHDTRLVARLDPSTHVVSGEGEVVWTNRSRRAVDDAVFHLYLNAFKNSRTAFLRSRLGEGRGGALPSSWGEIVLKRLTVRAASEPPEAARDLLPALERHSPGDPDDETDLRAALPSPCAPGQSLVFGVAFESTLPAVVERTGFVDKFHMVGQWFPKLARLRDDGSWSRFAFVRLSEFDSDFGRYDVTIEVPEGFVVGATGALVEEARDKGKRRLRYVQEDVHDFAWTAWDGFREQRRVMDGVEVRALYPEGHERAVAKQLDGLAVAVRCYGRRLGPYPYRTLTVVQPPPGAGEAGGMEYPTLITTGGPWFGPPAVRSSEAVTIHEFGHQYFYGLLASDEHRFPFLDEGLNTFVEGECLREGYGAGSLLALPGTEIAMEAGTRVLGMEAGLDLPIAMGAGDFPTAGHYGQLAYFRTGALLATLRGAYGAERVDQALGRYARAWRFRHPEPSDLIAAFASVDAAMGQALDEGLARRGWIDVAVVAAGTAPATAPSGLFDGPEGRRSVAAPAQSERHASWVVVARRGTLALPVDVVLRFADGSARRERWEGPEAWVRFDVEGPSALVSAEADPERKLLLDQDWSNNARSLAPEGLAAGVLERGVFFGGLLGYLLSP